MKTLILLLTTWLASLIIIGQIPPKHETPDTLWTYGQATDIEYGLTPEKPIKVGGGTLPIHIYRYLNNIVDTDWNNISYQRIGSCCTDLINRSKPLTLFSVQVGEKELKVYFDQYEWKEPKLLSGFEWKESRTGYRGELINGEIFNGYGLYFFEDGGYYKGLWKNGMMEGYGEMFIPDQEKYIGNFSQGKYHGEGTLYYQDGGRHVGRWKNGLKEGNGKLYYPPGCDILYIEGNFENDESTGNFKIVNSNGTEELYVFGK